MAVDQNWFNSAFGNWASGLDAPRQQFLQAYQQQNPTFSPQQQEQWANNPGGFLSTLGYGGQPAAKPASEGVVPLPGGGGAGSFLPDPVVPTNPVIPGGGVQPPGGTVIPQPGGGQPAPGTSQVNLQQQLANAAFQYGGFPAFLQVASLFNPQQPTQGQQPGGMGGYDPAQLQQILSGVSGLGGQIGGLQTGQGSILDLLGGLSGQIGTGQNSITNLLRQLGIDVGGQIGGVNTNLQNILSGMGGIGRQIGDMGGQLGAGQSDILSVLGGLGGQIGGLGGQLGAGQQDILAGLGGLSPQLQQILSGLGGLSGQLGGGQSDILARLGGLGGGQQSILDLLRDPSSGLGGLRDQIAGIAPGIMPTLEQLMGLQGSLGSEIGGLRGDIEGNQEALRNLLGQLGLDIGGQFGGLSGQLAGLGGQLTGLGDQLTGAEGNLNARLDQLPGGFDELLRRALGDYFPFGGSTDDIPGGTGGAGTGTTPEGGIPRDLALRLGIPMVPGGSASTANNRLLEMLSDPNRKPEEINEIVQSLLGLQALPQQRFYSENLPPVFQGYEDLYNVLAQNMRGESVEQALAGVTAPTSNVSGLSRDYGALQNAFRMQTDEDFAERQRQMESYQGATGQAGSTMGQEALSRLSAEKARAQALADLQFFQTMGQEQRADLGTSAALQSQDFANALQRAMAQENIRGMRTQQAQQPLSALLSALSGLNVTPGTVAQLQMPQQDSGGGFLGALGGILGAGAGSFLGPIGTAGGAALGNRLFG